MTKTFEKYEANGVSKQFSFSFPYLHPEDVYVDVDGFTVPFDYLSANIIKLQNIPAKGSIVRIQRITPADRPAYDFQLGAPFLPRFIDENFTQTIYAIQEALDAANLATDLVDDLLKSSVGKLDINNQTGENYTLQLKDTGDFIRMDNPGTNRVIVPPFASVEFAPGSIVLVRQVGPGSTRILGASGVTIHAPNGILEISAKDFGIALVNVAENEWDMINTLGSASLADLEAVSAEIDIRLDQIYAEILSNNPTFVVDFDSLIRKVEAATEQNEDLEQQILAAVESALIAVRQRISALEQTAIAHATRLDDLEVANAIPPGNMSTDGFQELPGGLLLQWLTVPFGSLETSDVTIERNFPKEFPNACLQVILSGSAFKQSKNTRDNLGAWIDSFTKSRFTIIQKGTKEPNTGDWRVLAIGY